MKKFLILVLFLCLASVASAVTVPPWWMIEQAAATGSNSITLTGQDALYSVTGTPASFTQSTHIRLAITDVSATGSDMTNGGYGMKAIRDGFYIVQAAAYLKTSSDTTALVFRLYKNDGGVGGAGTTISDVYEDLPSVGFHAKEILYMGYLNANDTVTPTAYHDGTAPTGSISLIRFSAVRLF